MPRTIAPPTDTGKSACGDSTLDAWQNAVPGRSPAPSAACSRRRRSTTRPGTTSRTPSSRPTSVPTSPRPSSPTSARRSPATTPPTRRTCSGCSARASRSGSRASTPTLKLSDRPAVVLVVGVNGVGKTTTIGKFAKFLGNYGRSVLVGAADTFRAAAVDQLATWAERAGAVDRAPAAAGPGSGIRRLPDHRTRQARGLRDRAHRHRRSPADEGRAHGRAHQDPSGHREAGARSPRCCSCSTRPPARTGSRRPRPSSSTPASPASCSPSSTAPPRAASC